MPLWIVSSAGSGMRDPLEPAAFELALDAQRAVVDLDVHDDRGVSAAELLRQHDTDLGKALIVGLQPGENQVARLVAKGAGERGGHPDRIGSGQAIAFDVNGAIGAAGERLAQHLGDAGRAGRHDDDLSAVPSP